MTDDRRREDGARAETLAARHLEAQGLRILTRNWRHPDGELDIVADDHGTCVFVEVRSRTGEAFGHPLEAVSGRKRAQVIRAAKLYLATEPLVSSTGTGFQGYRFDVVGVGFPEDGSPPTCHHVRDAFDLTR